MSVSLVQDSQARVAASNPVGQWAGRIDHGLGSLVEWIAALLVLVEIAEIGRAHV